MFSGVGVSRGSCALSLRFYRRPCWGWGERDEFRPLGSEDEGDRSVVGEAMSIEHVEV